MRILIAVAIMSALLFLGSEDAGRDEMIVRGAIVAFVGLAFPLTYLWGCVLEPAKLDSELEDNYRDQISELQERIAYLEDKKQRSAEKFDWKTRRKIADEASRIREFVLFGEWDEDEIKKVFHGTSPLVNRISYYDPEFSRIWGEFSQAVNIYATGVLKGEAMPGVIEFFRIVATEKVDEATGTVLEHLRRYSPPVSDGRAGVPQT